MKTFLLSPCSEHRITTGVLCLAGMVAFEAIGLCMAGAAVATGVAG